MSRVAAISFPTDPEAFRLHVIFEPKECMNTSTVTVKENTNIPAVLFQCLILLSSWTFANRFTLVRCEELDVGNWIHLESTET